MIFYFDYFAKHFFNKYKNNFLHFYNNKKIKLYERKIKGVNKALFERLKAFFGK